MRERERAKLIDRWQWVMSEVSTVELFVVSTS